LSLALNTVIKFFEKSKNRPRFFAGSFMETGDSLKLLTALELVVL
jgi:hypothetical protein